MPKPKQFLKENKKQSKHAPQVPTTADEYLAAGVDFEEAGEKWRGGDTVKSTRFFVRALDCYDEGLKKFPDSFDLAYNKARLQYELTQHPKLLRQLPGTLLELLQTAITSSSNLAQALRSYSEAISGLGDGDQKPATFLEEAMWALSFCLKLQKESYHHQQTSVKDVQMGGTNTTQTAETRSEEAIWARIVEPITPDTILDTLVAQLETLTMLSKEVLASDQKSVHLIVDRYKDMIKTNLATFTPLSENRSLEINLAVANYKCAIADLRYNAKQIELVDYENTVKSAYEFDIDHNPQALCDAGESYVNFHTAVAHLGLICEPYLTQRWDALSRAEKLFTAGYKIPNADHKEKILIIKGDVELLRFQLGQGGANQVHAVKYAQTLLANASKFYKVAKQIANEAGQKEETFEAEIKGDIVDAYKGKPTALKFTWEVSEEAKKLVKNAVADGIVTSEQLSGWGIQEY